MSRRGANWYKREPHAYLGGVRGLTERQHAVYGVVLELIYDGGGRCPDDPKWIAGWFANIGAAAVRRTILELVGLGKLQAEGDMLTNKRAKNEAKTDQELRENRSKTGQKGGKISAELRSQAKENNKIDQPSASTMVQPEKIREDKIRKSTPKPPKGGRDIDSNEFEEWYDCYPRKVAKGAARRAFTKARKRAEQVDLVTAVRAYAAKVAGKDKEFIGYPARWLNGERWLDSDEATGASGEASIEKRVDVAKDWLSRNDDIPTWMDSRETAEMLIKEGYDYEKLRRAGFSLPPRGNVVNIGDAVAEITTVKAVSCNAV